MDNKEKGTIASVIIGLSVILAGFAVVACAPKTPPGGYTAGYSDGVCVALTGSPGCDYAAMAACQDAKGMDRDTTYPCAWIPGRDDRGTGPATVVLDHLCPVMVWPGDASCLAVTPADRRTP